ncbi:MFS transporter [Phytomonospora sp. NPDC050363]|uniref:MFS transporter n=1 Tax=Phytomonospora sp. NPDC050363 TaxID=3155642 RepID=UPI0033ED5343
MFEKFKQRPVLLVCLAVFGIMTGQQMVNPVLAPLARELGLGEIHLGIVMTVGASGVVLISPLWGRVGARRGHKPVLLFSLVGAGAGLLAFALIARQGLTGAFAVPVLFGLILLARGLIFGLAWAAAPVTAGAYVSDVTTGETERVNGMSMIGAAIGLGTAVGPALGGLLVGGGLLVPLFVAPVLIAVITVLVWRGLPAPDRHRVPPPAVKVRARDPRMWPFLLTGFGMYFAIGVVMMTVGFLLQDRLDLGSQATGRATGLVMLAGAGMMLLAQAFLVPRLGWRPLRLIRVGAVVMTAGMLALVLAPNVLVIAVGVAVVGGGMGFGLPGYMAAPTLLAAREEQGSVAGLVASANAMSFVVGPLAGTALYEASPVAPYALCTVMLVALIAFVALHPGVRRVQTGPAEIPA